MNRTAVMRAALWASVVANAGAAVLFLFPASLGRLAGLPVPVPRMYTWFIAFMVALFAALYAWLARRPQIDRGFVLFAAAGKTGFFAIVLLCWLLGDLALRTVAVASGDLVFAAIFLWWLRSNP